LEDVADHVRERQFKLLKLAAKAGEYCEASEDDAPIPSFF
jgi:hypothetical protein